MKLQKRLAYRYKGKEYYKHVLTISQRILKELGWETGENLEQIVEGGRLIIRPKMDTSTKIKEKIGITRVKEIIGGKNASGK